MKIAIIGHKRIPSNEGGIEKGVEQYAVRMVQRGNDVTVSALCVGRDIDEEIEWDCGKDL